MKKIQIIIVTTLVMVAVMIGIGKVSLGVGAIGATVVDVQLSRIADGSASWDSTQFCDTNADNLPDGVDNGNSLCASPSTNAGNDMSSTNGVVRTGDTIQYLALMNLNEKDSTNAYFTAELSDGTYWKTLPSECLTEGVTPVSNISLSGTILTCNLGFRQEGITSSIMLYATVKGNVLNNTIVSAQITNAQADGSNVDSTAKINTLVTAGAKVDVEKKFVSIEEIVKPDLDGAGPDVQSVGKLVTFSITVKNLRGGESLDFSAGPDGILGNADDNSMELVDEYSMLGERVNTVRLYDWNGNIPCSPNGDNGLTVRNTPLGMPGLDVSTTDISGNVIAYTSSLENSTSNTGVVTCSEDTAVGSSIDPHLFKINFQNIDASISSFPSEFANTGIINDGNYFASAWIKFWVPFEDYYADINTSYSTESHNQIVPQTFKTLSGNIAMENDGGNGYLNNRDLVTIADSHYTFPGSCGTSQYSEVSLGDTVSGLFGNNDNTGNRRVFPGEIIDISTGFQMWGFPNFSQNFNQHQGICIKLDPTKSEFVPDISMPSDLYRTFVDPGNSYTNNPLYKGSDYFSNPFSISFYAGDSTYPHIIHHQEEFVIESTTSPSVDPRTDTCGSWEDYSADGGTDGWVRWENNIPPADLSNVTKVRVFLKYPIGPNTQNIGHGNLYFGIKAKIKSGLTSGTEVPVYQSTTVQNGGALWVHPPTAYRPSFSNQFWTSCWSNNYSAASSNRVTIQNAAVRIDKVTTDLANDMKSYYNPGDTVNFQLQPTIGYPSPTAGTTQ